MTDFTAPRLASTPTQLVDGLEIAFRAELDADSAAVFRREWAGPKSATYVAAIESSDGSAWSMRCSFGGFDVSAADDSPIDAGGGYQIHYRVILQRGTVARPADPSAWRTFSRLVHDLGPHPADVLMRMRFPTSAPEPIVSLPIEIGAAEFPGFSQIRGVQLAQVDEEDDDSPLYSVILQKYGAGLAAVTEAIAELTMDRDFLVGAVERAVTVTRLALPTLEVT